MDKTEIRSYLEDIINKYNSENKLLDLYEVISDNKRHILNIFIEQIKQEKTLEKQVYIEVYKYFHNNFEDDFELLQAFCKLQGSNKLPKLNSCIDNNTLLLNYLISAMNFNLTTNLEYTELKNLASKYYNYIIDYANSTQDTELINKAKKSIQEHQLELSNQIVEDAQTSFDNSEVGYFEEDYIDWCNMALYFNPENEQAKKLRDFCKS